MVEPMDCLIVNLNLQNMVDAMVVVVVAEILTQTINVLQLVVNVQIQTHMIALLVLDHLFALVVTAINVVLVPFQRKVVVVADHHLVVLLLLLVQVV
jgi:hypothetical protein